jgi:hypothetical protein
MLTEGEIGVPESGADSDGPLALGNARLEILSQMMSSSRHYVSARLVHTSLYTKRPGSVRHTGARRGGRSQRSSGSSCSGQRDDWRKTGTDPNGGATGFAGVSQLNIQIPAGPPRGDHARVVTVTGVSPKTTKLAVAQ